MKIGISFYIGLVSANATAEAIQEAKAQLKTENAMVTCNVTAQAIINHVTGGRFLSACYDYKDNWRRKANFSAYDSIIIDIDGPQNYSIDDFKASGLFQYAYVIYPSLSNVDGHNFRVIFKLGETFTVKDEESREYIIKLYAEIIDIITNEFGVKFDPASRTPYQKMYGCRIDSQALFPDMFHANEDAVLPPKYITMAMNNINAAIALEKVAKLKKAEENRDFANHITEFRFSDHKTEFGSVEAECKERAFIRLVNKFLNTNYVEGKRHKKCLNFASIALKERHCIDDIYAALNKRLHSSATQDAQYFCDKAKEYVAKVGYNHPTEWQKVATKKLSADLKKRFTVNHVEINQQTIYDYDLDQHDDKTIFFQSFQMTGKTTMIKHFADTHPDVGIIYITHRKSLSLDASDRIGITDYRSLSKHEKANCRESFSTCFQSLHKFNDANYTSKKYVIFIDEVTQLASDFISDLKANGDSHTLDNLSRWFTGADKVVLMDADYSVPVFGLFRSLCTNKTATYIENKYAPTDVTVVHFATKAIAFNNIFEELSKGAKLVCPMTLVNDINEFFEYSKQMNVDLSKYTIVNINAKDYTDSEKDALIKRVTTDATDIDLLIYSPACFTGISIEKHSFDGVIGVYSFLNDGTIGCKDIFQSWYRPRGVNTFGWWANEDSKSSRENKRPAQGSVDILNLFNSTFSESDDKTYLRLMLLGHKPYVSTGELKHRDFWDYAKDVYAHDFVASFYKNEDVYIKAKKLGWKILADKSPCVITPAELKTAQNVIKRGKKALKDEVKRIMASDVFPTYEIISQISKKNIAEYTAYDMAMVLKHEYLSITNVDLNTMMEVTSYQPEKLRKMICAHKYFNDIATDTFDLGGIISNINDYKRTNDENVDLIVKMVVLNSHQQRNQGATNDDVSWGFSNDERAILKTFLDIDLKDWQSIIPKDDYDEFSINLKQTIKNKEMTHVSLFYKLVNYKVIKNKRNNTFSCVKTPVHDNVEHIISNGLFVFNDDEINCFNAVLKTIVR